MPGTTESDQLIRIANIVAGANKYYARELLGEKDREKKFAKLMVETEGLLTPQEDAYRVSMERAGQDFGPIQATKLVNQIVRYIASEEPSVEETVIKAFVLENLFKNSKYEDGTFEPGFLDDEIQDALWKNTTVNELNRYQILSVRDPRYMLIEDQVRLAVHEGVENETFGEDSDIIGSIILKGSYPKTHNIDVNSADYMAAEMFYGPQIPNVLSNITTGLRPIFNSFTDGTGKGNMRIPIANTIEKSSYELFGDFAVVPDTSNIDPYKFRTDLSENGYFIETIEDVIEKNGGIVNTHDKGVTGHSLHAIEAVNREVKNWALKEMSNLVDEDGNILEAVRLLANKENKRTENWIVERVIAGAESFFVTQPNGETFYENERARKLEDFRATEYIDNPDKAKKQLENMLQLNPDYWVNGIPVEKKHVLPQEWAMWENILIQDGHEAAEKVIQERARQAVLKKEAEDFNYDTATKQAKEFFTRNMSKTGMKWEDIPNVERQTIIDTIFARRGIDIDRAMMPPREDRSTIVDNIESGGYSNLNMEIDPEVLFGQSILQFGTGAAEEYAAGQTFQKALSDPLATIYDILKEKGILKPGVSNEYLLNLDKNVLPALANNVMLGDYDNLESYRQEISDQIDALPAYQINSADYDRQMGSVPPSFPGLPAFKAMPATQKFNINAFTPELQEMAFERPELAGFIQQEIQLPGFEKEWQQVAQRQLRHDREGDKQLQDERLESFEGARQKSMFAKGEATDAGYVGRTREQAVENAEAFLAEVQASGTATEADIIAAESQVREAQSALASGAGAYQKAQAAVTRAEEQYAQEVPSPAGTVAGPDWKQQRLESVAQPGFMPEYGISATPAQQQFLAGMAKMMTTPGKTQQQFFESKLPGFQQRFEASPFFRLEQDRLEQEKVTQQRRTEAEERAEERAAESKRRSRLRGGSAMTVFGRRQ